MKILFAAALLALPFLSQAQSLTVKAEKVKISFVADMKGTQGTVSGFTANINFNLDDITNSTIEGSVDVNTLNTGNKKRDEHLKSSDFFDAKKFPKMTFTSSKIEKKDGTYIMSGIMKIKDVEREETITFSFEDNLFRGTSTIQATHYDLGNFAKQPAEETNIKISFGIPVE